MPKATENPYVVQPVMKALKVLELVARHGHESALTAVSKELRIPKTTTFRYLQTLTAAGFLDHNRTNDRYMLGPQMRSMARADASVSKIRAFARPVMTELMHEFNETVNLAVKGNGTIVYIDLIEANISEPLAVPDIARQVGISQRQLERQFNQAMGCSVVQFGLLLRLQHARVLLISTDLGVREISAASGFNSLSHFAYAFRKCFGRRPSEYRQAWPEQEDAPTWPGTLSKYLDTFQVNRRMRT